MFCCVPRSSFTPSYFLSVGCCDVQVGTWRLWTRRGCWEAFACTRGPSLPRPSGEATTIVRAGGVRVNIFSLNVIFFAIFFYVWHHLFCSCFALTDQGVHISLFFCVQSHNFWQLFAEVPYVLLKTYYSVCKVESAQLFFFPSFTVLLAYRVEAQGRGGIVYESHVSVQQQQQHSIYALYCTVLYIQNERVPADLQKVQLTLTKTTRSLEYALVVLGFVYQLAFQRCTW